MKEKIINYLLENANPSIVLRVKKEVLNNITESEETQLVGLILAEKNVKIATESQKSNGWIGEHFHGSANRFDNMEVGLHSEKGLPVSIWLATKRRIRLYLYEWTIKVALYGFYSYPNQ